jgi:hypothetical protein
MMVAQVRFITTIWHELSGCRKFDQKKVAFFLSMQIAVDCIWTHGHWTWMLLSKAITDFAVSEVLPTFGLTQPFPTVRMVQASAAAAYQFHIATAD